MTASRKAEQKSIKKQNLDSQQQLAQWINQNQQSFISRGICENPEELLTSGAVYPVEYHYRMNLKYSPCPGVVKDISEVVADLKDARVQHNQLSNEIKKTLTNTGLLGDQILAAMVSDYVTLPLIPPRVEIQFQMPLSEARKNNFLKPGDNIFGKLKGKTDQGELPTIRLNDGKNYQISRKTVKWKTEQGEDRSETTLQIEGVPHLITRMTFTDGYKHQLDMLCDKREEKYKSEAEYEKKYKLYENGFQLAADIISTHPVDKRLAQVWEAYKPLYCTSDRSKVAKELYTIRQSEIYHGGPDYYLYATYNNTYWGFNGNCKGVILRGKSDSIISDFTKADRDSDFSELKDVPLKKDDVVSLLLPYENKGELFALDLTQEDTIVIGPRAELAPYVNKVAHVFTTAINNAIGSHPAIIPEIVNLMVSYLQNISIFYIEDMNAEQMKFFNVPAHLQPKKIEAIEKLVHALESAMEKMKQKQLSQKSKIFNQWRLFAQSPKEVADNKSPNEFLQSIQASKLQLRRVVRNEKCRKEDAPLVMDSKLEPETSRCIIS